MNSSVIRKVAFHRHIEKTYIDHVSAAVTEKSLKDAHAYCIEHGLSAQKYGAVIENYIIKNHNFSRSMAKDCVGDCLKNTENYEIKVSLGGAKNNRFNYVQIRPSQKIHFYLFTAFHLTEENIDELGELYLFKTPKPEIIKLICEYGSYAHGTVSEHGPITEESVTTGRNLEYAVRPVFNSKCWKSLLPFQIEESDL